MGVVDSLLAKHKDDLAELVEKFESSGLDDKVKSWIGVGENKEISEDEVKEALGPDEVDRLAKEAGVDSSVAAGQLARELPRAVDRATPQGKLAKTASARKPAGKSAQANGPARRSKRAPRN